MAGKMSLADEIGQHQLLEGGCVKIDHGASRYKIVDKICWQDDVAQSQRWKEHFTEGADIDSTIGGIKPLQSCQRSACVPEFTIIIIFQYPGVDAACPL